MPRKTKTTAAEPVATTAAEPVAAEPTVKKVKRTREPAAPAAEAPAAPAVETPAAEAPAAPEVTIEVLVAHLKELQKAVGDAIKDVQRVGKAHAKAVKAASASQKRQRKQRDPNAPPPKPSGITMPLAVSAEILKFFGKPEGSLLSRTEVSGLIFEYVKANGLVDADKKSEWHPDAPLRKLLRLKEGDVLTMARTQKAISVHFPPPKTPKKAAAATTA